MPQTQLYSSLMAAVALFCSSPVPASPPVMKMHIFAQQKPHTTANRAIEPITRRIDKHDTPQLNMVVFNEAVQTPAGATEIYSDPSGQHSIEVDTNIKGNHPETIAEPDQTWLMYDLNTGYQRERMSWNVAAPNGSPNPLTEAKWNDQERWGFNTMIEIVAPTGLAIKSHAGYAGTYSGKAQETSFASDGYQNPFSQIDSNADDGYAFDGNVGLGYQFLLGHPQRDKVWFAATPLTGYAYRQQKYVMSDGQQTFSGLGSDALAGKENTYISTWHGPWLGIDMKLSILQHHELFTSFEHHWIIDYEGEGEWQQAANLLQPDSFTHNADGTGYLASIGYRYRTSDLWGVSVSFDYQNWNTDPGTETLHYSTGQTVTSVLNRVERETFGVNLGFNVAF